MLECMLSSLRLQLLNVGENDATVLARVVKGLQHALIFQGGVRLLRYFIGECAGGALAHPGHRLRGAAGHAAAVDDLRAQAPARRGGPGAFRLHRRRIMESFFC